MVHHYENLIIGAGPAGIQLGYLFAKRNRSYCILEKAECAGSFFKHLPIHRNLISINKIHNLYSEPDFNLRHDWNSLLTIDNDESCLFKNFSQDFFPPADAMLDYLNFFVQKNSLNIRLNTKVLNISHTKPEDAGFCVTTNNGKYTCNRLFMATGVVGPYIPDIKGIENCMGYEEFVLDQEKYINKSIAIIGCGNSAFEVANYLSSYAGVTHILLRRPLRLAWETHFIGDLRAINNAFLDMFQLKSMNAVLLERPIEIQKTKSGFKLIAEANCPHWEKPGTDVYVSFYDLIIRCTGWKYIDLSIFSRNCSPKVSEDTKYAVLNEHWESSIKNLYFIGTSMAAIDKKAPSGFIHGFRYNIRSLFNILEKEYYHVEYPSSVFDITNEEELYKVANFIVHRLSTTSALNHLYGFMSDIFIIKENQLRYFNEFPVGWVKKNKELFLNKENVFIITFEYGFQNYDPQIPTINYNATADVAHPDSSPLVHPIIRQYRFGKLVKEKHFYEKLLVRFNEVSLSGNFYAHLIMNMINAILKITKKTYPEIQNMKKDKIRYWTKEETNNWYKKYPNAQRIYKGRKQIYKTIKNKKTHKVD